jgi:hypothetical protein
MALDLRDPGRARVARDRIAELPLVVEEAVAEDEGDLVRPWSWYQSIVASCRAGKWLIFE